MISISSTLLWIWVASFMSLLPIGARGFSWGTDKSAPGLKEQQKPLANQLYLSASDARLPLPNTYAIALSELEELESEPLCHRIAARLLVNNCQLLDGQNEASVLMDSGRAARDFVDFYAASLAICDLERGSFTIPASCSQFRESALAVLTPPTNAQLHVSSSQIDKCLEGLAQSDPAWNTWVSYRHKALRFCEAARIENEKDETIRVHKKVTKVLAKLTKQVEDEMEARTRSLDLLAQKTAAKLERLAPQLDHMKDGLSELETILAKQVSQRAAESAQHIDGGLYNARALHQILNILLKTTEEKQEQFTKSHETALQVASQQVNDEVGIVMASLAAVVSSSAFLQREMETSQQRAIEIEEKQNAVQEGLDKLTGLADSLSLKHESHQERLERAQHIVEDVLHTLDSVSTSAISVQGVLSRGSSWTSWWPYIFCPATSLVVGSYGLAPSAARNFVLIGLGQIAGIFVSMVNQRGGDLSVAQKFRGHGVNDTSILRPPFYSDKESLNHGVSQSYTL